jgi:hypothetical protein
MEESKYTQKTGIANHHSVNIIGSQAIAPEAKSTFGGQMHPPEDQNPKTTASFG